MAKLTKSEIYAIASEILKEARKKESERSIKEKERQWKEYFRTPEGKLFKKLQDMNPQAVYPSTIVRTFENNYVYYNIEDIENALIIEQIDTPNVKDLIEKIKKQFTK